MATSVQLNGPGMHSTAELDQEPVRQSGTGSRYLLLEDVPEHSREALWQHLGHLCARLMVDSSARAARLQDYLGRVELQREAGR